MRLNFFFPATSSPFGYAAVALEMVQCPSSGGLATLCMALPPLFLCQLTPACQPVFRYPHVTKPWCLMHLSTTSRRLSTDWCFILWANTRVFTKTTECMSAAVLAIQKAMTGLLCQTICSTTTDCLAQGVLLPRFSLSLGYLLIVGCLLRLLIPVCG
jgi:hypothetical protein